MKQNEGSNTKRKNNYQPMLLSINSEISFPKIQYSMMSVLLLNFICIKRLSYILAFVTLSMLRYR